MNTKPSRVFSLFRCRCNSMGSMSSACDIVTGQCQCKANVAGRQCHQCEAGHWGLTSGAGCAPCSCDNIGSFNVSCDHDIGQCHCRPGVGGTRCDHCLPGHYGFSERGCQVCDACNKPGHICDPDTGGCVCPRLTLGEHCDHCRPGSYDLVVGIGCKPCGCSPGSVKGQCDATGQCPCRVGFDGLKCDRCAAGYYGYPRCRPCNCHNSGTLNCPEGLCQCDQNGQCPCKENVVGRQCDQCKPGFFGLAADNSKGCTECFCFGRSSVCQQAGFSWGERHLSRPRLLRINDSVNDVILANYGHSVALSGGLNVTNSLSIIPGTLSDVMLPANLYYGYPLYWQLPDTFLGDKVISYGGYLKFKTSDTGGIPLRNSYKFPVAQIQGNGRIVLEYYENLPINNVQEYSIRLHESSWQIRNRPDYKVSREVLMVALQNIQHILLKASDNSGFEEATLLEASLDAAVLTPTRSPPLATGVEICECPAEYNGTSCQDPSIGYYRWYNNATTTSTIVIDLVGQARRCQCNERSEVCDRETGYCLNCRDNTAGHQCEVCAESFHGHPDYSGCRACPCPHADKRFSSSCDIRGNEEPVCHCKPGYSGATCERCSYGYYGYPEIPGGHCTPCNCNPAGSASDECDEETGQCNCKLGATGRDCSQCTAPRHVFINGICTSCSDNCTGILLDDLSAMSSRLATETSHITNGIIPLPWVELTLIDGNTTQLHQEIERISTLKRRIASAPRADYKMMMLDTEEHLKDAVELNKRAWDLKPSSEDIKNNIFSAHVEVRNLRDLIEATTSQLLQYGDDVKKVGIKRSLKEARMLLHYIKSLKLAEKKQQSQEFIDEVEEYISWLNSQFDAAKPIETVSFRVSNYSRKAEDLRSQIENTMEDLFIYDGLSSNINVTYKTIGNQHDNINILFADSVRAIDEGLKFNEESEGFVIDSQSNFQDLPELQKKLNHWSEKLDIKEEILYRLNYEYEDKYVIKAVEHARNLSDYVDRYVALFDKTRNDAANPLKASEAYKNIVDSLTAARMSARSAKDAAWEAYHKVFPSGPQAKSMLDSAAEMSERSAMQLERAQELDNMLSLVAIKSENQAEAVLSLKDSLNSTGVKDNQINIKLRELHGDSNRLHDNLTLVKSEHEKILLSLAESEKLIQDYNEGVSNVLRPQLNELKREGDSKISLASEQLTEAQSNMKKADAKLISLAHASAKRQLEFDKWNETLGEKLKKLKDKIAEARNTAEGIKISLKSAEGKKCVRSYRPINLQPSTSTSIVITFAITHHRREGSLFYLPSSINDDFVALELFDGQIRFLWNVGGGTGILVHPEILDSGDPRNDDVWYRVEAELIRNKGKLFVRKQVSTTGKHLPVTKSTNPEFARFDVNSNDRVWLGGIPPSQRRPAELLAENGLPGCVHQVILDGKPLGLWNFITTAPDKACKACQEGVENARDDVAYSFNGLGYAVRNRVSSGPYSKYTFGVSLNFRTFDENSLLFLGFSEKTNQHVMIFLREGRVVLQIRYGDNISMEMSSTYKYNNGNWSKVDAFRQYQVRKGIEKCSLSVGGDSDKRIGAPTPQPRKENIPDLAEAKYYIGGVPPSFRAGKLMLPSEVSFLGCMSNIVVQDGYDPLAEQYYGVEPSCSNKPLRIVGFYGDGYLEHRSFPLRKISSIISFSFRTMQTDAALVLSTFQGQDERMNTIQGGSEDTYRNIYYSVAIVKGQVQIRVNAGPGELILQSNSTFNDGKYHSVTVFKKRKEVELRVDDAYQAGGKLPTGEAIRAPDTGGLFFGGLPALINSTNMIGSVVPLYGAISNAIFNEEVLRFDRAVTFDHALIGRPGPSMGRDPPSYTPSASLSRGLSTQPEGCRKVPYYSLQPGALKFGDKSHSHTQLYLNFKQFWENKYVLEFDFRTYYPNGLLFITPGIKRNQFLMMTVRDGHLSLLMKRKQKKEILFQTPFNDGNWHHVVISHSERKLTLVVDAQTPKTIKVPRKVGLEPMMFIGGVPESGAPLPEQVVSKLETLKGCIRGLKVNGDLYDMVGSTSRPFNVGQCFPSVESGAYFQDEAYAIYKQNFKLEGVLELQLEFRTSELSGILLSITAPDDSSSLSLELSNGRVIMSADLGGKNPLFVEQHFPSPYTICDNRWHKIQAVYNNEELTLKVDELDQKYGLPAKADEHFMSLSTSSPLYIGGLPASAPKGTLTTRDHFNGCIRNVMIGGERRDWTDMAELHNIHLSSCPVQ